jgi:hypothetical protein
VTGGERRRDIVVGLKVAGVDGRMHGTVNRPKGGEREINKGSEERYGESNKNIQSTKFG